MYISQVLEGLVYLHDQGVIHRDIKGANILTNKDGCVKLADFGVASSTAAGAVRDNEVVGSPYWSASLQHSFMTPSNPRLSGSGGDRAVWRNNGLGYMVSWVYRD